MNTQVASAALLEPARMRARHKAEREATDRNVVADAVVESSMNLVGRAASRAASCTRNAAPESSVLADIGDAALAAGDVALTATREVFGQLLDGL